MAERIMSEPAGQKLADHIKQNGSNIETVAQAVLLIQNILSGGTPGSMAAMFDLNLSSVYNLGKDWQSADPEGLISTDLNLAGFATSVGTSGVRWKQPTVEIGQITWSDTIDSYNREPGTADVSVIFPDGSRITRTANFTRQLPGGRIYAVTWDSSNKGYIDTGLTQNYGYTFKGRGRTVQGAAGVILGSYTSNSDRTSVRFLGGGNNIQHMWATNNQIGRATSGVDVNQEFEFTARANYFKVTQGSTEYETTFTNDINSGTGAAKIYFMNEQTSGNYANIIACEGQIIDTDGVTVLRHLIPYHLADDEIVILDVAGLSDTDINDIINNADNSVFASRIYRPVIGTLVEVDAA